MGSHLPCAGFKGWGTRCGNLISHSLGKDLYLYNPSDCGSLQLRCGLFPWRDHISVSLFLLSVLALSLSPCCEDFSVFRGNYFFFPEGIVLYVIHYVDLLRPWEEGLQNFLRRYLQLSLGDCFSVNFLFPSHPYLFVSLLTLEL